jgi:hypothetical protein
VNAEAAIWSGFAGFTARFGSLSLFVSKLNASGIMLTIRIPGCGVAGAPPEGAGCGRGLVPRRVAAVPVLRVVLAISPPVSRYTLRQHFAMLPVDLSEQARCTLFGKVKNAL